LNSNYKAFQRARFREESVIIFFSESYSKAIDALWLVDFMTDHQSWFDTQNRISYATVIANPNSRSLSWSDELSRSDISASSNAKQTKPNYASWSLQLLSMFIPQGTSTEINQLSQIKCPTQYARAKIHLNHLLPDETITSCSFLSPIKTWTWLGPQQHRHPFRDDEMRFPMGEGRT
jgi:hypothetical protein